METKLSCREFVEFLADYVAGQLSAASLARFNVHLARCTSCASYTRTYREAIRLGQDALRCPDERVPDDVPEDLLRAILAAREEKA